MSIPLFIEIDDKEFGNFSVMKFNVENIDMISFLDNKKLEIIHSDSDIDFDNNIRWNRVVFKTKQNFYLCLDKTKNKENSWDISVYYKSKQQNELILFMRQIIKQIKQI